MATIPLWALTLSTNLSPNRQPLRVHTWSLPRWTVTRGRHEADSVDLDDQVGHNDIFFVLDVVVGLHRIGLHRVGLHRVGR